MRATTYVGLISGFVVIYLAVLLKGGDHTLFLNPVAGLIALGGTFAATTLSCSRSTVLHATSALRQLFWSRPVTSGETAEVLINLARQARAGGVTSLNPDKEKLPFLVKGLRLVADGVDGPRIEELLRLESDLLTEKRRDAERMFRLMGTYSPMFGLIGTLIGLIQMLKDLTDPRAIGHGMSVALMATFYGVLLAGLIFLPLAGKLRSLDMHERLVRDAVLAGVLAIRAGQNPENVRETAETFAQKAGK